MAKRRSKKRSGGGRRRMGAARGNLMNELIPLFIAGGAGIAVQYAKTLLPDSVDPKLSAGGAMAIGLLLAMQRNPNLKYAGFGSFVGGSIALAKELNVISGVGAIRRPLILQSANGRGINGFPAVNQIGAAIPGQFPSPMTVGRRRFAAMND